MTGIDALGHPMGRIDPIGHIHVGSGHPTTGLAEGTNGLAEGTTGPAESTTVECRHVREAWTGIRPR